MQLTLTADYAARVMIYMASLPAGTRASRDHLASAASAPVHFLSKILQILTRSGLLVSHRGATGGFSLARPPEELTLFDIVDAIDGPILLNRCLAPGKTCDRQSWCAAHLLWADAQRTLVGILRSASLADLARDSARWPKPDALCVLAGTNSWN